MNRILLVAALGCLSACATTPAVSAMYHLDPDTGKQCQANCKTLGMSLDAVVVIANATGCVCTPRSGDEQARAAGGASAVGGALTTILQQQRQRRDDNPGAAP